MTQTNVKYKQCPDTRYQYFEPITLNRYVKQTAKWPSIFWLTSDTVFRVTIQYNYYFICNATIHINIL